MENQMEVNELEENNRKQLAGAFAIAIARSSIRSEKVVHDSINTLLAVSFNNEKTGEPEVTNDPTESPGQKDGERVEDQSTEIPRHLFQKIVEANTFWALRP